MCGQGQIKHVWGRSGMEPFESYLHGIALDAASALASWKAANVWQEGFGTVGIGADGAPTSRLDRVIEAAVLESVMSRGEEIGAVLSEEAGWIALRPSGNRLVLVVDPLDGTNNAEIGLPLYALSLAVVRSGEVVAGLVYHYDTSDEYFGEKGAGAYLNGRRIRVSVGTALSNGRIALSRPFSDVEADMYAQCTLATKRVRVTGCPSLDTVFVARGAFMAYVDYHVPRGLIKTHDVMAARLILEEAGGFFLDEAGQCPSVTMDVARGFNVFAVNDIRTYRELRRCFVGA